MVDPILASSGVIDTARAAVIDTKPVAAPVESDETAPKPSAEPFGPAVELDLSPPAQAIVDNDPPSGEPVTQETSAAQTGSATAATPSRGAGGGASPASTSESTVDVAGSLREVAAQVGVAEANSLVDDEGNINRRGLARALDDLQASKNA